MFTQLWRKYLPVILIMMKRSSGEDQVLSTDQSDFLRAAGGKKIRFAFTGLSLTRGKLNTDHKHNAVALDLAKVLQEEPSVKNIIYSQVLHFSLGSDFKLLIHNATVAPVKEMAAEM